MYYCGESAPHTERQHFYNLLNNINQLSSLKQFFVKMSKLRREVLNAFKKLHRTRQLVFAGDDNALHAGRKEINDRFRKNKTEINVENIRKMMQLALDVEIELRSSVIQAREKDEGVYELRITPDTTRLDNFPFNPDAVITKPLRKGNSAASSKGSGGCSKK